MRHASRWNLSPAAQRCFTTLMMCLRGSVCIYQGEELGPAGGARSPTRTSRIPTAIKFWPEFKGRDGCRTPMVWEPSNDLGGFTSGDERPWLPVAPEHLPMSVAAQERDPAALLHHYRRAIGLRAGDDIWSKGGQSGMEAQGDVLRFTRTHEGREVACLFNLGAGEAIVDLPAGDWRQVARELGTAAPDGVRVHLGPWQPCLLERAD